MEKVGVKMFYNNPHGMGNVVLEVLASIKILSDSPSLSAARY